jgi:hypothetical protein
VPTSTTAVIALRSCLFIGQLHPLSSGDAHLVASDRALSVTA